MTTTSDNNTSAIIAADPYIRDDPYRPSWFELIQSEHWIAGFRPGFRYLLQLLARRWPACQVFVDYHHECFLYLFYYLESHYLRMYDGSFVENFFLGLRRVSVRVQQQGGGGGGDGDGDGEGEGSPFVIHDPEVSAPALSSLDRRRALFALVVWPYLLQRVETYYLHCTRIMNDDGFENEYRVDQGGPRDGSSSDATALPSSQWRQGDWRSQADRHTYRSPLFILFRRWFIQCYPYFHTTYDLIQLICHLRYLLVYTDWYNPWMWWMSQHYRRLSRADMTEHQRRQREVYDQRRMDAAWPSTTTGGAVGGGLWLWLQRLRVVSRRSAWTLAEWSRYLLVFGIFAYKLVEWWHSPGGGGGGGSGGAGVGGLESRPIPPPPSRIEPSPQASSAIVPLPRNPQHCPICRRQRANPCCTTTGYVFCYACIHPWVREHGMCPVSHRSQRIDQLRRVFSS